MNKQISIFYIKTIKHSINPLNGISELCRAFVLIVVFGLEPVIYAQTNSAQQQVQIPSPLLFNALKDERFSTAYKRAFEAYWGLKWVSLALGPTSPAEKKTLKNGEIVYLFSTCRVHACDTEHLYFLYAPASGRGWGVLNVRSDIEGAPRPSSEVKNILLSSVETGK